MKKILIFLLITGIFSSCSLFEDEDDDAVTYYEAEGEGYVFYAESKMPIPFAKIYVSYIEEGNRWGSWTDTSQKYFADENGFFRIKFLKRINKSNIKEYMVNSSLFDANNHYNSQIIFIKTSEVEKLMSNKLNLDTLWLRKSVL
ncbi:MAG: hypothetical protein LBV69_08960 [Bacteroidales bacterium]|jgi:hypothetical protein|nr:hypothetical protein [Bacteroidales bacterium]